MKYPCGCSLEVEEHKTEACPAFNEIIASIVRTERLNAQEEKRLREFLPPIIESGEPPSNERFQQAIKYARTGRRPAVS